MNNPPKTIKHMILPMFIVLASLEHSRACFLTTKITVYIANYLDANSPPLHVRCQSGDDDLGNHTIPLGKSYEFDFCESWSTSGTLFFCHLFYGRKDVSFDAFNAREKAQICDAGSCVWVAEEDGIYVAKSPTKLEKKYNWVVHA